MLDLDQLVESAMADVLLNTSQMHSQDQPGGKNVKLDLRFYSDLDQGREKF